MRVGKYKMALLILFLSVWCGRANAADVAKIGIVDLQRIFETSNPGKSAQAEIKKQKDAMEQELQQKGAEIEQLKTQYERESMVMSKEKREEREREARIKLNDFKELQNRYRSELQALEQKLGGSLRNEINGLVEEIGKKEGYLLIIRSETVLYRPDAIDITDQLIKQLNERHAKKTGN
jgi:outer membrane protein